MYDRGERLDGVRSPRGVGNERITAAQHRFGPYPHHTPSSPPILKDTTRGGAGGGGVKPTMSLRGTNVISEVN